MEEEIQEERKQRLSDIELLETLNEGINLPLKRELSPPRLGITVENYYSPEEAKNFVTDVLSKYHL